MDTSVDDMQAQQDHESARSPSLRHNRDFIILWTGQLISQLGSSISSITVPLLVLALTGSAAQAGLAGFLAAVPYVIFSLPAGALIDRWNRKRVMMICDAGRAVALGSIPLAAAFGHLSIIQLYIAVTIEGSLFTFFNIAEVAAVPRVVSKEQLPTATSRNQVGQIAAFLVGPPVGGFVFQVLGKTIPYLFDAISYAYSIVSLLFIRTEFQETRTARQRSLRSEIVEGLSWLWRQPLIRFMAFLTGGLNFTTSGLLLLTIVLAKHQHASPTVIGLMFALARGVGATGLSIQRFGAVKTVLLFSVVLAALGVLTTVNRAVRHAPPIAEAHVA